MKKILFGNKAMIAKTLCAVATLGASTLAHAAVTEGLFEDAATLNTGSNGAKVIIKNVNENGVKSSYAILLVGSDKTAFFRIEEVDESTQAWVQLFQSRDNILAADMSQEATYAVTVAKTSEGRNSLDLAPTSFGKGIGCSSSFKLVQSRSGDTWQTLAIAKQDLGGPSSGKASLRPSGKPGQYNLKMDANIDNRTFSVTEIIPGLGVARAQTLNPESIDGRSLERQISYVAISIKRSGIFSNYDEVRLLKLTAGQLACLAPTIKLSN